MKGVQTILTFHALTVSLVVISTTILVHQRVLFGCTIILQIVLVWHVTLIAKHVLPWTVPLLIVQPVMEHWPFIHQLKLVFQIAGLIISINQLLIYVFLVTHIAKIVRVLLLANVKYVIQGIS